MRQSEMYIRKIPGMPKRLQVAERLNEIYKEHGCDELVSVGNYDGSKRGVIETESIELASRKLDVHDKRSIEVMSDTLSRYCGKTFGEKSAHQVLAKIGILLNSVETF